MRMDTGDEQNLRLEHVADAGDDALVEEHVRDRLAAAGAQAAGGSARSKSGPASPGRAPAAAGAAPARALRELGHRHVESDRHARRSRPRSACPGGAAASARRAGRDASCRSSACACAGPGRPRKAISRCLPREVTDSMVRPASGSSSSTRLSAGNTDSNRVTVARQTRCMVRAARKMVSPSGICLKR